MENSINNINILEGMEEVTSNVAQLKVVGVGGAGGNAVNDMLESGITGVEFIAINTDLQDLDRSKTQTKVLLGKGTGAGAIPEKGRIAAKESEEKIKQEQICYLSRQEWVEEQEQVHLQLLLK